MIKIKLAISRLRRRASQRGQGMVEFALVLPVLILLLIGIMEFGYFFFIYSSVNTAAREAVRYGSASGDNGSGTIYYEDCAGIREVARRIGKYANIQNGDIAISYDTGPSGVIKGNCGAYEPELGERIVVRIAVAYRPIILFGGRGRLTPLTVIEAESARTIIKRVQVGG